MPVDAEVRWVVVSSQVGVRQLGGAGGSLTVVGQGSVHNALGQEEAVEVIGVAKSRCWRFTPATLSFRSEIPE